jgi:plastocyanin
MVLGACSNDGESRASEPGVTTSSTTTTTVVLEGAVDVEAADNRFIPEYLTVRAGSVVRFANVGRNVHDVIPVDGGGFEIQSEEFDPGEEASFTLSEPGRFRYYCSIHGTAKRGMVGTITVVR